MDQVNKVFMRTVQMGVGIHEANARVLLRQLLDEQGMGHVCSDHAKDILESSLIEFHHVQLALAVDGHGEISQDQPHPVGLGAVDPPQ